MKMKLQLFADEAGAAENENASPSVENGNEETVKNADETPAENEGTDAENSSCDGTTQRTAANDDGGENDGDAVSAEEMARIIKIAEAVAKSNLEKTVRDECARQVDSVKTEYPSFNIKTEMSNPAFARLVAMGVPLKNAYESANFDRLIISAMRIAAKKTAEKMTTQAQARIGENPVLDRASAVRKTDVGSLTEREIRRVIEAAGRGEKITFR